MKITHKLLHDITGADDIQHKRKTNTWVFRRGFFYSHGYTSEKYASKIKDTLAVAGLVAREIDNGEIWKDFRGGASTRAQSHWYVEIRFS